MKSAGGTPPAAECDLLLDCLCGTAAGEDTERAVAAGLAARAPDNFGAERLAPHAAGEGAAELAELTARGGRLERLAQVIELRDCRFDCHIVLLLFICQC